MVVNIKLEKKVDNNRKTVSKVSKVTNIRIDDNKLFEVEEVSCIDPYVSISKLNVKSQRIITYLSQPPSNRLLAADSARLPDLQQVIIFLSLDGLFIRKKRLNRSFSKEI